MLYATKIIIACFKKTGKLYLFLQNKSSPVNFALYLLNIHFIFPNFVATIKKLKDMT